MGPYLNGEGAGDFGRAAAIDDGVVAHQVAGNAQRVMQAALDLVKHHLVAAAHKDGHRLRVGAVLDHQHAVLGCAEGQLPHHSSPDMADSVRRHAQQLIHPQLKI